MGANASGHSNVCDYNSRQTDRDSSIPQCMHTYNTMIEAVWIGVHQVSGHRGERDATNPVRESQAYFSHLTYIRKINSNCGTL